MKSEIQSAIILSAGQGKRLFPITEFFPKALLPIANTPAIAGVIKRLRENSIENLYVNTFHHAEQIKEFIDKKKGSGINIEEEDKLRNTGGGIANFQSSLSESSFLLHNCDIYTEQDLSKLISYHQQVNAIATLMFVDYPRINSVLIDNDEVLDFHSESGNLTYSGIAVFSPLIWKYFPDHENFSLISVLDKVLAAGEKIAAFKSEAYWSDFGTPQEYWALHRHISDRETSDVENSAYVKGCTLKGFNYIGGHSKVRNSALENCIVLPGAMIKDENRRNSIFFERGYISLS